MVQQLKKLIVRVLYKPSFALLLCLLFLFVNLVLDGTLFRVFRLNRDLRIVKNRIEHIRQKNQDIKDKIKTADDPDFVEKELRKRLDYTGDKDLIFIFPEKL